MPRLGDVRRERQGNYSSGESADDFMDPLKDSFRALTAAFEGDQVVKDIVDRETSHLYEWIAEHSEEEGDGKLKRTLGDVETLEELDDNRSIFDDVDA